jgi:hypothetical protein
VTDGWLITLQNLGGVTCCEGADADELEQLRRACGVTLPPRHRDLLRQCNGISTYDGYHRLLGVSRNMPYDAVSWNDDACWKFAWAGRCADFWCFAESAFGDQYAYSIPALQARGRSPVYMLYAFSMLPEEVADTFEGFMERVFLPNAAIPIDRMLVAARRRFGPIRFDEHLVYNPPLALGGHEHVDCVYKMNARAAMVCNGDVATQLDRHTDGTRTITGIETYQDDAGRLRVRLTWA